MRKDQLYISKSGRCMVRRGTCKEYQPDISVGLVLQNGTGCRFRRCCHNSQDVTAVHFVLLYITDTSGWNEYSGFVLDDVKVAEGCWSSTRWGKEYVIPNIIVLVESPCCVRRQPLTAASQPLGRFSKQLHPSLSVEVQEFECCDVVPLWPVLQDALMVNLAKYYLKDKASHSHLISGIKLPSPNLDEGCSEIEIWVVLVNSNLDSHKCR